MGNKANLEIFRVKNGCTIGTLPFSPEQRAIFDAVMEEESYEEFPNSRILEVLQDQWGLNAKKTALSVHRRKKCLCFTQGRGGRNV